MRLVSTLLYATLLLCTRVCAFIPGIDGPLSHQEALEGGNTTFLCDTTPDSSGDEFMILVWYKNNIPIYSFEIPDREWADSTFNATGRMSADVRSQPTAVTVSALTEDDQAVYHCRVDFRLSPTRNIGVNLTVVVLPSPPFFMDELDNKVERTVGTYHEGDTLVLKCLVIGGRPPPRLSWYSGSNLVDASDADSDIPSVRENELYLPLTRANAGSISCRASNTNLAPPVESKLDIELYLPAYNVSIHWVWGTADGVLRAGHPVLAQCTAPGSYPQPDLSWWLDQKHLTRHSNQSWVSSSSTAISYLELHPSVGDDGATLACVATNHVMAPSRNSKADVITLNVTYSPLLEVVRVGDGKLNEVVELDPLHLECEVKANPPAYKFIWYFNDSEIKSNSVWGENVTSQVLYVEEATREHAGRYSCVAVNSIGETRAESFTVTVLYPPECSHHGIRLVKEALSCNVKALPAPDTYLWHIEPSDSLEQRLTTGSRLLPLDQITGSLDRSLKASCEASNGIASQERACERTFSFEQLRPRQPQQCDLAFEHGEFHIRCVPVENATYYEVSVWKLSTSNSSLVLEKRASMGFGSSQALSSTGSTWLVRAGLGKLGAGDEAGALACNRYGCSKALLLRPSETLLKAASPPWWNVLLSKEVCIPLVAAVLLVLFAASSAAALRAARRARTKPPVIQVLQLDDVTRNFLDNLPEHKLQASCSLRSCSSGYSEGSQRWGPPPPDVTLTLHRESAV
ncbi:hemicentin-1-like [Bombyx mandarina]|uniref:Hemicentin-1-like n=1 Tax=Bombyx mandarina TaxID=7092 RepID=A0A6J2JQJ3_BOMMA|nr:hemicentin-1-like [Bombyx mandarina]